VVPVVTLLRTTDCAAPYDPAIGVAEGVAAVKVYCAPNAALVVKPLPEAMAYKTVPVVVIGTALLYTVEEVVGVVPSVV